MAKKQDNSAVLLLLGIGVVWWLYNKNNATAATVAPVVSTNSTTPTSVVTTTATVAVPDNAIVTNNVAAANPNIPRGVRSVDESGNLIVTGAAVITDVPDGYITDGSVLIPIATTSQAQDVLARSNALPFTTGVNKTGGRPSSAETVKYS
jgi:hypothetical protein